MRYSTYNSLKAKFWIRRSFNPLLEKASLWLSPAAALQAREVLYQNIVHRDLDRLGISMPMYPIRSAATYSYLYLLLRTVQELGSLKILELGAGLSTALIERLAPSFNLRLTTLEHDANWVERMHNQGVQSVRHSDLIKRDIRGHKTLVYDSNAIDVGERFNVLLVDGPRRSRRRSRWTALEYIESWLEEEFMIVFDDAERPGEIDTIAEALRLLDKLGIRYGCQLTRSVNSQFLIATEKFQSALYF